MPGGVTSYGMSCIRSFEYTVGPIEPGPDDEIVFMRDTATSVYSERAWRNAHNLSCNVAMCGTCQ